VHHRQRSRHTGDSVIVRVRSALPGRRRRLVAAGIICAAAAALLPNHRVAAVAEVRVSVLMYHYIRTNPVAGDSLGFGLSVTPADFARQVDYLWASGAHTVSMGDVVDAMETGRALPPRSVVLTFDDGYGDFATAAVPIMAAHGFIGTTYTVPGFLGRPGYMTATQLQHAAGLHMVIGAHTLHHVDLPRLSDAAAWTEIAESRHQLQQLTGQPVNDFAYPYGHFNSVDVSLVHRAGFRDAVTTYPGNVGTLGTRYVLPRVRVNGGESLAQFAASIGIPQAAAQPLAPASGPGGGTPLPNANTASAQPVEAARPPAAIDLMSAISRADEFRTSWIRGSRIRTF
jgi:peptidoglycan/xylan/chitin deacetylase (PgdA/CDA1 family)